MTTTQGQHPDHGFEYALVDVGDQSARVIEFAGSFVATAFLELGHDLLNRFVAEKMKYITDVAPSADAFDLIGVKGTNAFDDLCG